MLSSRIQNSHGPLWSGGQDAPESNPVHAPRPVAQGTFMKRTEGTSERHVTRDAPESAEGNTSCAFAHRVLIATCLGAGVALVLVGV